MAWLEIHQSIRDHRKTIEAADLLGISPPHMLGLLVSLWLWAIDNVADGNIGAVKEKTISRAAQWEGDPQSFLDALVKAKWVDRQNNGLFMHDWEVYTGKLIGQRIAERERSRQRRAKDKQEQFSKKTSAGQPMVDHQTAVGTLHYTTLHNTTLQNHTPPLPPAGGNASPDFPEISNDPQCESLTVEMARGTGNSKPVDHSMTIEERFKDFWALYPRKQGKGAAEKAWKKIKPTAVLLDKMISALKIAKTSYDWTKENGRYVPNPATWLNQKRWEDELVSVPQASTTNAQRSGNPFLDLMLDEMCNQEV